MSARVALVPSEQAETRANDVLIHVRFTPSADIFFIDAVPTHSSPKEWFIRLLAGASDYYRTLAGGRGFFRIPRDRFDAILAQPAE